MNAAIDTHRDQLRAATEDAAGLAAGVTDAQFNWRPASDRWSMAECLEHLSVTAGEYLPRIDAAIEQARARGLLSAGPFAYGWIEQWIVRSFEPPPGRRFTAPARFLPAASLEKDTVVERFAECQRAIDERLRNADGVNLRRVRVVSPVLPLMRVTLGQTFALLLAHERRHLWQARQVRHESRFPV